MFKQISVLVVLVAVSEAARMSLEAKMQYCANNPGMSFHDGCNHCTCAVGNSGESVCNMLPCPDDMGNSNMPSQEIPAMPNCVGFANVQWTDGCNMCKCSADPMSTEAACTRRGCDPMMRSPWRPL
ncbi:U-reduvitoxin-Pr10a-like isoform X2 [Culicoides brevitarsis]|uniref:U-reduvitoxin-Pr10a-like isoform X2 n=1 Tax=Culicoides brevitarsis TaxID=469753 RepID=UPI00307B4760